VKKQGNVNILTVLQVAAGTENVKKKSVTAGPGYNGICGFFFPLGLLDSSKRRWFPF